jgi:hypothetical protein
VKDVLSWTSSITPTPASIGNRPNSGRRFRSAAQMPPGTLDLATLISRWVIGPVARTYQVQSYTQWPMYCYFLKVVSTSNSQTGILIAHQITLSISSNSYTQLRLNQFVIPFKQLILSKKNRYTIFRLQFRCPGLGQNHGLRRRIYN